jgi:hypothetical protein
MKISIDTGVVLQHSRSASGLETFPAHATKNPQA